MPFTPVWFTGFENGEGATAGGKTGSYYLSIGGQWQYTFWTLNSFSPQSDFYFGTWLQANVDSSGYGVHITFGLSDGNYLRLWFNGSFCYGDINGNSIGTPLIAFGSNTWRHLQVHIQVSDIGLFECKIDGCSNFSYSGDTKPGVGTTVTSITFSQPDYRMGGNFSLDDMVIGTNDWPGDLRVYGLQPSADTATAQWTPSTGATNFGCVDERPPSDTDYISTTLTGQRTILDLTDFDTTSKTPIALNLHSRLWKSNAANDTIKFGLISNGVETTVVQEVTTNPTSYKTFYPLDPNGNIAWSDGALDALQIVVESVVT